MFGSQVLLSYQFLNDKLSMLLNKTVIQLFPRTEMSTELIARYVLVRGCLTIICIVLLNKAAPVHMKLFERLHCLNSFTSLPCVMKKLAKIITDESQD